MNASTAPRKAALGLAVAALVAAVLLLPLDEWTTALLAWVDGLGAWSGIVLGALWIPVAVMLVPGVVLTLGTGFLLGVGWGLVVVSIGSTLGASAAFLVGRTLMRERVRVWVEERPRFRALDRAVGEDGMKVVLLTRLSPLFPYNFQNYAYALTSVSARDFVLGSWIGMLPGTLMYVYLGSIAGALATLGAERGKSELEWIFFGLGLVATVVVTWIVTRRATRALEEVTQAELHDERADA